MRSAAPSVVTQRHRAAPRLRLFLSLFIAHDVLAGGRLLGVVIKAGGLSKEASRRLSQVDPLGEQFPFFLLAQRRFVGAECTNPIWGS